VLLVMRSDKLKITDNTYKLGIIGNVFSSYSHSLQLIFIRKFIEVLNSFKIEEFILVVSYKCNCMKVFNGIIIKVIMEL
jgi:hypothetical protein